MDGISSSQNVLVIGATNFVGSIDPALRRPGRFELELVIKPPNADARHQLLVNLFKMATLDKDVDLNVLAKQTNGYVGADLVALAREVISHSLSSMKTTAAENQTQAICYEDFLNAIKRLGPPSMLRSVPKVNEVLWADIGGLEDLKRELKKWIEWPLLYPETFERTGVAPPRGILLYGPPGCSKTTLVRAIATVSRASFFTLTGASLYSSYVGESEAASII